MHSPPENGKAGCGPTRSGLSEKHNFETSETVTDQALPVNVARLKNLGVRFNYSTRDRQIILPCPICRGRLVLHDEQPWQWCVDIKCKSRRLTFEQIIYRIVKPSAAQEPG